MQHNAGKHSGFKDDGDAFIIEKKMLNLHKINCLFQMLDLSYNNLSADDILSLGSLPNLRVLHLSGNNLKSIPTDISLPPRMEDRYTSRPFPCLFY